MSDHELIYVKCLEGCESYLEAKEYYLHRMNDEEIFCTTHGLPYQPALNLNED
jgi:hypothetical protein